MSESANALLEGLYEANQDLGADEYSRKTWSSLNAENKKVQGAACWTCAAAGHSLLQYAVIASQSTTQKV
ncbi:uncharacterized protein FTOL_01412 [Fusarium torulosum]|uniref:Uncharacterized protein n=1 Tax=Fusarium torulosum TaxID=33205 RepID=A0AAE8SDU5_9HYPO|nr:uncharacterized protein FTOL_01412 [Fusarium torulosum]